MLNSIVSSVPTLAFASRIACRSDPGPLSFVVVTANDWGPAVTRRHPENSDVPSLDVAVAVID